MRKTLAPVLVLLLFTSLNLPADGPKKEEPVPIPAGTRVELNVPYVEGGDPRQVMDIYLPPAGGEGDDQGPYAFVLYIHGGGLKGGTKDWARKEAVNSLIPVGIAVAAINYRLLKTAPFPAQMEDTLAASRWLKAHGAKHGLDPERAGVWGYSAGAMLAGLLATTGDAPETFGGAGAQSADFLKLDAAVIWAGRADLTHTEPMLEKELKIVGAYFGGATVKDHLEQARQASPVNYISAGDPPIMLVHGDQDIHANVAQVAIWEKALAAAQVPYVVDIMEGSTHDIPADYDFSQLREFLGKNLVAE